MSEVHLLNVGNGDCTIYKANSNRVTMIDICKGNLAQVNRSIREDLSYSHRINVKGNYQMCKKPTNPLEFISSIGVSEIFRFILTHPDMDHLDGFNQLLSKYKLYNYWDNGLRKEKPNFDDSPYEESDWDRYENVRDDKEDIKVINPLAGTRQKYYNSDDENGGGDFLFIYAPSQELVDSANENQDVNDGSYVITYRSLGGRIVIPGDAHDATWEYVIEHYKNELYECEFMLAPHHGRDSNRSWQFLDELKPKFSLLGCAASEHLAYDQWNRRGLEKITQNQAGNVAIYPDGTGLNIFVENDTFVSNAGGDTSKQDSYGNYYLKTIPKNF